MSCSTKASWDGKGLPKGQAESQRKASRHTVKQSWRDELGGSEQTKKKERTDRLNVSQNKVHGDSRLTFMVSRDAADGGCLY